MGRTSNITKEMEALSNSFKPLELREGNVQAIFNRCLATSQTSKDNIRDSILFQRFAGFKENSTPISFDKNVLLLNKNTIKYLYGQLKSIHSGESFISPQNGVIDYNNKIWTNNNRNFNVLISSRKSSWNYSSI